MFEKNRWPDDPRKKGHRATIVEKVEYVARLEREHANLGVSIHLRNPRDKSSNEDVLDHVIGVLHAVAEMNDNPEEIHQIA